MSLKNCWAIIFSRRSSYTQALNVVLSLTLALLIDYVKNYHARFELTTYSIMFITGGVIGLAGALVLASVPEPESFLTKENIFKLFRRPLKDGNFQSLLLFNSAWTFALNMATPFFTVFMIKSMGLSLSYVVGLSIISQLCSILTIRIWGKFADRYSNKTIIAIGAPLYILCIIAWCFVGIFTHFYANLALLIAIHVFSGIASAGINLSVTNIGLKLAPREGAIVYLSVRNIVTSIFSSVAPLIGGVLADYFTQRSLTVNAEWSSPRLHKVFHLLSLHEWNFLFLIGAFLALLALELLNHVKEVGEVEKDIVVRIMRSSIRNNLKESFLLGNLIGWHEQFWKMIKRKTFRRRHAT